MRWKFPKRVGRGVARHILQELLPGWSGPSCRQIFCCAADHTTNTRSWTPRLGQASPLGGDDVCNEYYVPSKKGALWCHARFCVKIFLPESDDPLTQGLPASFIQRWGHTRESGWVPHSWMYVYRYSRLQNRLRPQTLCQNLRSTLLHGPFCARYSRSGLASGITVHYKDARVSFPSMPRKTSSGHFHLLHPPFLFLFPFIKRMQSKTKR